LTATNRLGGVTGQAVSLAVVPRPFSAVVAWGQNTSGQATVPAGLRGVKAISAGYAHTVILKHDGTALEWGKNQLSQGTYASPFRNVTAIAAGAYCTLVVRQDRSLGVWGFNGFIMTNLPVTLRTVTAISVGNTHAVALKEDGALVTWGIDSPFLKNVPAGLGNVIGISAGAAHTVVLKSDGTVASWGNAGSQTNVPAGLAGVVAVAAGGEHTLVLKRDGSVVAWGGNHYGQANVPPGLNSVVTIAAGADHSVALKADGTVTAWGDNSFKQCRLPADLPRVKAIAAGGYHTVGLLAEEELSVAPAITRRPVSQTRATGSPVVFEAGVTGIPAPVLQWQYSNTDGKTWMNLAGDNRFTGVTTPTLRSETVVGSMDGLWFRLAATNEAGEVISAPARLSVVQTSPRLEAMRLDGAPTFILKGESGVAYRIDYSDSLSPPQWKPATNLILRGAEQIWSDESFKETQTRFYRVVQP
jgi:hypothetical protein